MHAAIRVSLMGLFAVAACDTNVEPGAIVSDGNTLVHSVTVSPPSLTLVVGGKGQLTASVNADTAVTRTVIWSSSDGTIASVDTSGTVTAVRLGTANIKAVSSADPTVFATASVQVTASASGDETP